MLLNVFSCRTAMAFSGAALTNPNGVPAMLRSTWLLMGM